MDLTKLGRLSCLSIADDQQKYFEDSLKDVVEMMDNLAKIDCQPVDEIIKEKNTRQEILKHQRDSTLLDREEQYQGIHLEQTMFLAPKVIKKD